MYLMHKTIKRFDRIKPKNKEDEERDQKYYCFKQRPIKGFDNPIVKVVMYFIGAPIMLFRFSF